MSISCTTTFVNLSVTLSINVDELVDHLTKFQLCKGVKLDCIKVEIGKNFANLLITGETFDRGGVSRPRYLRRNRGDGCCWAVSAEVDCLV